MAQKTSIPKGTRDFGQKETAERNYIFDTLRSVFATHGYAQIETPAMENLSTLLGKYGEEGDKLLYRILNSGDAFANADFNLPLTPQVCEKGLRYDLTVPFARYVVQHQAEISFPFKRCQIQPVWRADRPQKGRYREFYQCDVDVIGSKSQLCELDLIQIIDEAFGKLGIRVLIKVNNRKILAGLAEVCGVPEKLTDITVAIDKIDKTGLDAVKEELREKGLDDKAISLLEPVLLLDGNNDERLGGIRSIMQASESGRKGVEEMDELLSLCKRAGIGTEVQLDFSLARGLNYYTGAIFEVKALDWQIGSICGGGRYDNLTGIFGLQDMSGVGISFGADRIYDVMKGLDKFPDGLCSCATVLFANMGAGETAYCLDTAGALRKAGIAVEVYPESVKLKKQFDYAGRKGIPFISINGEAEMNAGLIQLKNLNTAEQKSFGRDDLASLLEFIKG